MDHMDTILGQIQHQRICFSACGFFGIDMGLLFVVSVLSSRND